FTAGPSAERGYFGPWQTCKYLLYDRKKCGSTVSRFKPVASVEYAGWSAVIGVFMLAMFSVLAVLQLAMIVSKEKILFSYGCVLMAKLICSLLATLVSVVAAALFALQTDDRENDFIVTRGESFYIQIAVIVLTFVVFVGGLYDVLFARRWGPASDPTIAHRDPSGQSATTYNNPGFKERKRVSMTHASGRPYGSAVGGSEVTLSTVVSSNGSAQSPLRSSLKKPRPPGSTASTASSAAAAPPGLGIHNPGFSGSSPTPSRNGSVKRVRIQTNSTAV
ncbi:hypothetical protein AAG570_005724, partial [Ranatra chinensis]